MINQEAFKKIKEKALEDHIPILMDDTLAVIQKLLAENPPTRILEIGTAVGYSASCFAMCTDENCIIDTIEIDEERAKEAIQNIETIGLTNRIHVMVGNAIDILPTLQQQYDFMLIDAAKSKYTMFLEEGIKLMKPGGRIVADNVLYKGYVLGEYHKHKQRTAVRRLREYLKEVTENPRFETQVLEVGDGLAISKVV